MNDWDHNTSFLKTLQIAHSFPLYFISFNNSMCHFVRGEILGMIDNESLVDKRVL